MFPATDLHTDLVPSERKEFSGYRAQEPVATGTAEADGVADIAHAYLRIKDPNLRRAALAAVRSLAASQA